MPQRPPSQLPGLPLLYRLTVFIVQLGIHVPDLGAGPRGQLGRADYVILVAMGLQDVPYAASFARGPLDIHSAVPPRVDDRRGGSAAADIGVVSQSLRFDSLDKHSSSP